MKIPGGGMNLDGILGDGRKMGRGGESFHGIPGGTISEN